MNIDDPGRGCMKFGFSTMSFVKILRRFAGAELGAVCLLAAVWPVAGFAQDPARDVKTEQVQADPGAEIPWLVNCASLTGHTTCEAVKRLQIKETGQLLISISVRMPPEAEQATMMIQLPHGLYLPDGITMAIDGEELEKQPIQTCDPEGCYVGLSIKPDVLEKLQDGKQLLVAFGNLNRNKIEIPIFLGGFREAFAKLS
ncbi:hypothetical protein E2A64_03080 [Pseudohoeflea suaedae]|uniref:Invasion associated locus B family protein n=1 Tax=Pseudohoeflea suaedae TaxID=877384 RepID=A0A4R5PMD7_9HYPH|nr:invasion associated locus B family protein [Pseudohoeflea suaedae]TDH38126.1 hypothetical protein E2A64_03080 [Pseudohoeflea suaedae]